MVTLRDDQLRVVQGVIDDFDSGKQVVLVDSPTGSGKSLIAAELAQRFWSDRRWRTATTTPQLSLLAQLRNDPNVFALAPFAEVIKGRSNYDCHRDNKITVADAVCYEEDEQGGMLRVGGKPVTCRHKRWNEETEPSCAYYHDKMKAELSPLAITSLAYFLVGTRLLKNAEGPTQPSIGWDAGGLSARDVLIVDEAHGLENGVIRHLTTTWTDTSYMYMERVPDATSFRDSFTDWMESPLPLRLRQGGAWSNADMVEAITDLKTVLLNHESLLSQEDGFEPMKEQETIAMDELKLKGMLMDLEQGIPWIARFRGDKKPVFEIQPVMAGPHLRRAMWNRAQRYVLLSGYFVDPDSFVRRVGLAGRPGSVLHVASRFPPEKSPIYSLGVARFVRETQATAILEIADMLWRISRIEPGRGLIHTQSFVNAAELERLAPPDVTKRVVAHHQGEDREELIKWFTAKSPPGTILMSPSLTEGLDLPGDRGEWCAFLRAPFPSMGDERVIKRMAMPDGNYWYEQQAVEATVQGLGRTTRSETDESRRYLLDTAQIALLYKWRKLLPPWFLASMEVGDRGLPVLRERLALSIPVPLQA